MTTNFKKTKPAATTLVGNITVSLGDVALVLEDVRLSVVIPYLNNMSEAEKTGLTNVIQNELDGKTEGLTLNFAMKPVATVKKDTSAVAGLNELLSLGKVSAADQQQAEQTKTAEQQANNDMLLGLLSRKSPLEDES